MRIVSNLSLILAVLVIFAAPLRAEEATSEVAPEMTKEQIKQKEKIESALVKAEKKTKKAQGVMNDLAEDLNEVEARHLSFIYNNHNIISVVKQVRGSIEKAVTSCGAENSDMKIALEDNFQDWKNAVNPVLKEAQDNLNNLIIAQDYAPQKKLRNALKLMDEARAAGENIYEKKPVTSKEACEKFSSTLTGTQEKMESLLRQTLISLPRAFEEKVIKEREEAAEKAQEKAAEKAAKNAAGDK